MRLTRKYSEAIDGVDLSRSKVGDRLRLPEREASLLIAEGWAIPCDGTPRARHPRQESAGSQSAPDRSRHR